MSNGMKRAANKKQVELNGIIAKKKRCRREKGAHFQHSKSLKYMYWYAALLIRGSCCTYKRG